MGILALESKDNTVLVVHANGVMPGAAALDHVEAIAGWYSEMFECRHRVELIQLASDDRPQRLRNPTSSLAIHAVPNIPSRVVPERPNH